MSAFTIIVREPRVPTTVGLKVLNALNADAIVRVVALAAGLDKETNDAIVALYASDKSTTLLTAEANVPASRIRSNVASAAKKLNRSVRVGTLMLARTDGSEFAAGHFFYAN